MFDTIKGVNVKGVNVRFLQFIQRLNLAVTLRSGLAHFWSHPEHLTQ